MHSFVAKFAVADKNGIDAILDTDETVTEVAILSLLTVEGPIAILEFVIKKEKQWINLLGIESPGLTASPVLAEEVLRLF